MPPQVTPVTTGLGDKHPYVRRTAVMGVLKIWHMSPDTVNHTGMVEQVRAMLYQDQDPQVVANCLQMVCQLEPMAKLAADKQFVYHLINRLKVGLLCCKANCFNRKPHSAYPAAGLCVSPAAPPSRPTT